jgi:hypothetical protein
MAIDTRALAQAFARAFLGVLKKRGPAVVALAKSEAVKFARSIATIESLRAGGLISEEEAQLQLEIQRSASRAVFTATRGVSIVMAEQAINAGLDVAKAAVNGALGFPLIR